jgi:DNA-binding PadR family transcriptional regulator
MRSYFDNASRAPWRPEHRNHHPDHHGGETTDGGLHRGGRRGARPHRGRRRAPRGDVRTAVLRLLAEQPMHGYQLMQAIADRTGGGWQPSPGAIYPTINQLEDEGLVTLVATAGRKLVTLTDAGRQHISTNAATWPDPFTAFPDPGDSPNLRAALEQVTDAVRQVGRTGTDAQLEAAGRILAETRKALYLLLADGPQTTAD